MTFVIKMNKPEQVIKDQIIEGGQPLDMEPSGEEKFYEIKELITNLGGPIKSRYINLELRLEGLAGDFEKVLEMNEHRIRDKALSIMGGILMKMLNWTDFRSVLELILKKHFRVF